MADFVLNFVAMTTGVGRGKISLASFNSPTADPEYSLLDAKISELSRIQGAP